jgi:hypothetical protein
MESTENKFMKNSEIGQLYEQTSLAMHGMVILLLGLLSGIAFSYAAVVAEPASEFYGSWRFAHLEGIINGLLVLAVAAVWHLMNLQRRGIVAARWLLLVGCYANILGPIITAVFIGHRVIMPTTGLETAVVFGLYIPGTFPLISMFFFISNLYRSSRQRYYLYRSSL